MSLEFGVGGVQHVLINPHRTTFKIKPNLPAVLVAPLRGRKGDKGDPGSLDDLTTVQEMIDETVEVHVNEPEPHPAYDDLPSLVLLFENGIA